MNNKRLSRQDFIKILGGFLVAPFIAGLNRIFSSPRKTTSTFKEARFYKSGDKLAG